MSIPTVSSQATPIYPDPNELFPAEAKDAVVHQPVGITVIPPPEDEPEVDELYYACIDAELFGEYGKK
jgi:hypothetical protein